MRLEVDSVPRVARDARPQARTLLIALAVTVLLWFLPFADLVTYPIRLFVTFVHEGGHALAALLTGNRVLGLQVAPGGGGLTYTTGGGLAGLLVSSAGYLGAMAYGTLLLVLVRRAVAALPAQQQALLGLLVASPAPSYAQISARLGMPVGSIGPTRARILARLRTTLETAGVYDAVPA